MVCVHQAFRAQICKGFTGVGSRVVGDIVSFGVEGLGC